MSDEPAVLHWQDEEIKLRVVRGTEDEAALDISKLRANTGLITLDYGYRQHRRDRVGDHLHRR